MLLASLKGHHPLVKIPLTMIFIKRGSFFLHNFQIRYNAITVFADLDGDKNVLTAGVIKKLFALRDHPYMMSAKFWDFVTPSPLVCI